MQEKIFPDVASFLIRFVQDQPTVEGGVNYRGVVRHIQTDKEIFFTNWEDLEAFIQQVIPLDTIKNNKGDDHEVEG